MPRCFRGCPQHPEQLSEAESCNWQIYIMDVASIGAQDYTGGRYCGDISTLTALFCNVEGHLTWPSTTAELTCLLVLQSY